MVTDKEKQDILTSSLSNSMERRLESYFSMHNGNKIPEGLYDRIIKEIEKSIIKVTVNYVNGNKLKAAKILGINRNTLRKKMSELNLHDKSA